MQLKPVRHSTKMLWGLILALLITTLACGFGSRVTGNVEKVKETITEKAEGGLDSLGELAKNTAKDAVVSALNSVDINKSFNLSIPVTDSTVNQIIALKEKANKLTLNQQLIENMRLSFTGGNVVVTGNVKDVLFKQLKLSGSNQLTVIFRPGVTDGKLQLALVEAKIGATPAPESVFSAVEQAQTVAANTLEELVNGVKSDLESEMVDASKLAVVAVNDIVIEEGKMTVKLTVNIP